MLRLSNSLYNFLYQLNQQPTEWVKRTAIRIRYAIQGVYPNPGLNYQDADLAKKYKFILTDYNRSWRKPDHVIPIYYFYPLEGQDNIKIKLTEAGKEAVVYEQQRRKLPPYSYGRVGRSLTAKEMIDLKPKPNDVCEYCDEEIFVPFDSVRCEHGSCVYDVGDYSSESLSLQMEWSRLLEQIRLVDKNNKSVYFRPPTHMCMVCYEKPHFTMTLPDLVSRGRALLNK